MDRWKECKFCQRLESLLAIKSDGVTHKYHASLMQEDYRLSDNSYMGYFEYRRYKLNYCPECGKRLWRKKGNNAD